MKKLIGVMLYILFAYNVMINVNVDLNPNRNDIEKCKNKLEHKNLFELIFWIKSNV